MTTDHRAEAEWLLADADDWASQAGELSPRASERACLDRAQVHALLAIHDTLTDPKPEPVTATHPWRNPLTATHPWPPWPSTLPDVDAADRYAANEARQREAGDADGAPSVTAPAADDPADDAVGGEEGERRNLNAQDAELSRLLAVRTDPTAALRRAAMMEAVGVTSDQTKWFAAQILAKGRLLPDDLQRLKAAVEQTGDGRG